MLKNLYGIIVDGKLKTADALFEGYKPFVYADIPEFAEDKQYIVQANPLDRGEDIFVGIEIKDLPIENNDQMMP